jgi:hypothetical protein
MKILQFALVAMLVVPSMIFAQEITTLGDGNILLQLPVSEIENSLSMEAVSLAISEEPANVVRIRDVNEFSFINVLPYTLFAVIDRGLPAETVMLILMIPLLTTLIVFTRNILGIPSLDMLVIIAFSIALLASDILIGTILLFTILLSSMVARVLFKKAKIMQLPKISLSMMVVTIGVLAVLSILAFSDLVKVENVSIVPILLLIILSERIVRLEFEQKPRQVWTVIVASLLIGVVGYYILLSDEVRTVVLNFPELILLLIPFNLFMGRYFGLRLSEYSRFSEIRGKSKKTK